MKKTDVYCFKPLSFGVIYFAALLWQSKSDMRKFLFVTLLFLHNFLQQSTLDFPTEANKKIAK